MVSRNLRKERRQHIKAHRRQRICHPETAEKKNILTKTVEASSAASTARPKDTGNLTAAETKGRGKGGVDAADEFNGGQC